ncbi:hypothetical protein [Crocosphaera sp. Alani8]|uniref:hypothetical protein n=1 Tax=Crocosphaera sp. Alani8 TaxID=3038952 RepID=UPI00313AE7DC
MSKPWGDTTIRILSLGTRYTADGGDRRRSGKTSVLSDANPNEVRSPAGSVAECVDSSQQFNSN